MQYPTIYQYAESLLNSKGLFRRLEGRVKCIVRHDGQPEFYAGNFGVVFKIMLDDKPCALKLFTRHLADRDKNYQRIGDYIAELNNSGSTSSSSILSRYEYYEQELFVFSDDPTEQGKYHSLIIMDWIDGRTMSWHIERAVRDENIQRLRQLESSFKELSLTLLAMPMAHGDLKPENIMIDNQTDRMVLVDYDALYIPCMKGSIAIELGTPPYQHPMRCRLPMNDHIDDYPIALIMLALKALTYDSELWYKYQQGDNLLFDAEKIHNGTDECYNYLKNIPSIANDPLFDVMIYKSFEIDGLADIIQTGYRAVNHNINDSLESYELSQSLANIHIEPDGVSSAFSADYTPNNALVSTSSDLKATNLIIDNNNSHNATYDQCGDIADCELHPYRHNGLWGYISSKGDWLIEPQFIQANNFYESLALVRSQRGFGYINCHGEICIPDIYEDAGSFSESLASVRINGKYGYIDKSGRMVVKPKYDYAGKISHGLGLVKRGELYGYISSDSGRIAISVKFEYAEAFSESVAVVKTDNKYGYINTKGRWCVKPVYSYARKCIDGKIYVENHNCQESGMYVDISTLL